MPALPFTAIDSSIPNDLWNWMDGQRKAGNELLAISHNANLSDGIMFPVEEDYKGRPIDAAWAQQRMTNEPLTEIIQIKGASETHPALSPNDEFADYQIMSFLLGSDDSTSRVNGSYVRQAYQNGLGMQQARGYNPYKMGVVGASDSHNTVVSYTASNFFGQHGGIDASAKARMAGKVESGMATLLTGTSGLGGVWAEQNTRESIFAAMQRKETFGTSGVRIKVRMFGGWDFKPDVLKLKDWVAGRLRASACRWAATCRRLRPRRRRSSCGRSRIRTTPTSIAFRSSKAGPRADRSSRRSMTSRGPVTASPTRRRQSAARSATRST